MLLLDSMDKDVSFAVLLMIAGSYMRMKDIESFCDNLPHHPMSLKLGEKMTR